MSVTACSEMLYVCADLRGRARRPGPDGGFSTDERWDPPANPMGEGCLLSRLLAAENEAQRDGRQGYKSCTVRSETAGHTPWLMQYGISALALEVVKDLTGAASGQ
jgi:hypothetical protein